MNILEQVMNMLLISVSRVSEYAIDEELVRVWGDEMGVLE